MALIRLYTRKKESISYDLTVIEHDTLCWRWVLFNIAPGENFKVYDGDVSEENEISRDHDKMKTAADVSVILAPAGGWELVAVAVIAAFAVTQLIPQPKPFDNVNRQQESPNNSLTDRNNVARPNQRIVDICGQVKSILDVIQPEWSRYENGIEVRTGAYCVARKQLLIEELRDGGTLFTDSGQSAGIYYPFRSPNNSQPDIQIGPAINQPVCGVFESSDAIDQVIPAINDVSVDTRGTNDRIFSDGTITADIDFTLSFEVGDSAKLFDFVVNGVRIGESPMPVIFVSNGTIRFDITGSSGWSTLPPGPNELDRGLFPRIDKATKTIIGRFTISSRKVDRLIFNVYAPVGLYQENNSGRRGRTVVYRFYYQKLDDNLNPIGPESSVDGSISGNNSQLKGDTVDVNLGGLTFVRWSVERLTPKDYDFEGNVVDEIQIKSLFGLYDVDRAHFGDITMIQTERKANAQTLQIKSPEVNCLATEMINRYLGSGVFDTALTPNTQGMQSLIRVALDDWIGRRDISEIDADLLIELQDEIEEYFQNPEAGSFNYSFDSTNISPQETFYSISNAIFCTMWREGRVLKSFFERPQSIPRMVFTHGSKKRDSETWNREFTKKKRKDSVIFAYTDDEFYTQEKLYIPSDRSGRNPETIEIPGIKGLRQATWRALREYNKLIHQEVSVDFTASAEGRFVKPQQAISVVKGSRVSSFDGYIRSVNGLDVELSQDVRFTARDEHSIILKRRNGDTETIPVFEVTGQKRVIRLGYAPVEAIYTGNSANKTEFSFGNEARLLGQLILPQEIDSSQKDYVQIKGIGYSDRFYEGDPVQPVQSGFDDGFDDGFF